ncbi:MAG TPA: phosphoglycerate kinase, partial [Candidatus Baltobacteraceae bacterium]|nr:phosphoglycerate kinase [Candidatus Baltobacteraceae bacterium]
MSYRKLTELDVRGKRVLVREDLNVPIGPSTPAPSTSSGASVQDDIARDDIVEIVDYARIDAALPTLRWLHDRGARTIVCSHLGRPDGKADPRFSLRPVAGALSQRLGLPASFAADCVGEVALRAADALNDGDVLLLENV